MRGGPPYRSGVPFRLAFSPGGDRSDGVRAVSGMRSSLVLSFSLLGVSKVANAGNLSAPGPLDSGIVV
jgi:hypothetical protein